MAIGEYQVRMKFTPCPSFLIFNLGSKPDIFEVCQLTTQSSFKQNYYLLHRGGWFFFRPGVVGSDPGGLQNDNPELGVPGNK